MPLAGPGSLRERRLPRRETGQPRPTVYHEGSLPKAGERNRTASSRNGLAVVATHERAGRAGPTRSDRR